MKKGDLKYFLAANSSEGFVSSFGDNYNAKEGWRVYIIKGGPGTGKSSFMKFVAKTAKEKNITAVACPCSSDPDSLDGVIFPDMKTAIFDGTSPHIIEPYYAGVCEEILNFGQFWDEKFLLENRAEIIKLTDENKEMHKNASKYLTAAGSLLKDNLEIFKALSNKEKLSHYAKLLSKKYIKGKGEKASLINRYICGTTPNGVVSFSEELLAFCQNTVIIEDESGFCADALVSAVCKDALSKNYSVIALKNPFLPSALWDGIIIEELSLAILREYSYQKINSESRRIHARRFIDKSGLKNRKCRIKFNSKIADELIKSAIEYLKKAKAVHDELEKYYVKAMDFTELLKYAEGFSEKLF